MGESERPGLAVSRALSSEERAGCEVALARDGYAIVPALLDDVEVTRVLDELTRLHAHCDFGDNEFSGTRTKRAFNLFAKTRALDPLLVNPDVLQIVRSALGPEAQLSIASTMEIHGGESTQPLHQDDAYFPDNPHVPLVVNTIWALTDFTASNGATRLVPGSHLRAGPVDPAEHSIAAEMPHGSVLIWNGAVWHGGGANTTGSTRFGVSLNYCRGWIRQQENQYLGLEPALVSSLPEDVQKLLGYDVCQFVGWVDGRHPTRAILPEVRARIYRGEGGRRGQY